MATGNRWTAQELATLERAAREGKSAREATTDLPGRTRSAILGAAHRKGIHFAGGKSVTIKRMPKKRVRVRQRRDPKEAPRFRPSKPPQPKPPCFTDEAASRAAAAYFSASDAAQRRRDGYRGNRAL